ncbi:MAG TPA: hypothetical protein ENN46_03400 [Candidatus Woesearchaeota archaeon]|nr:hypothetical protein [Candidatus Woesearchaeota archaeon]
MLNFKIFGRKELPSLDEDIDLEELNEPEEKDIIEHLKQELENLKHEKKEQPKKEEVQNKEVPDFRRLSEVIDFLQNTNDASFRAHEAVFRNAIVVFLDSAVPESALSFEVSLLKDRQAILDKLKGASDIYGDISLGKGNKPPAQVEEEPAKKEDKTPAKKHQKKSPEPEKKPAPKSESGSFDWANKALKPVPEHHHLKIGDASLSTFEDFCSLINSLPEHDFNILVLPLPRRNGIASWLEHVIGFKELSRKLMNCFSRKDIVELVNESFDMVKEKASVSSKETEPAQEKELSEELPQKPKKDVKISSEASAESRPAQEEPVNKEDEKKDEPTIESVSIKEPNIQEGNTERDEKALPEKEAPKKKRLGFFNGKPSSSEKAKPDQKMPPLPLPESLSGLYETLSKSEESDFLDRRLEYLSVIAVNKVDKKAFWLFENAFGKARFLELLEKMLYSMPDFDKEIKDVPEDFSIKNKTIFSSPAKKKEPLADSADEKEQDKPSLQENQPSQSPENPPAKKKTWALFNRAKARDKAISSKSSKRAEGIQEEENSFFNDAAKLKQELRDIKYESIVDLPPPERVGVSEKKDRMIELIKPDLHNDELFQNPAGSELFDDPESLEHSVSAGKGTKPDKEQSPDEDLIMNEQLSLLEKELELIRKKREILKHKSEKEKDSLERISHSIKRQEEVLESLAEVAKYSVPEKSEESLDKAKQPVQIPHEEISGESRDSEIEKLINEAIPQEKESVGFKPDEKKKDVLLDEIDSLVKEPVSREKPEPAPKESFAEKERQQLFDEVDKLLDSSSEHPGLIPAAPAQQAEKAQTAKKAKKAVKPALPREEEEKPGEKAKKKQEVQQELELSLKTPEEAKAETSKPEAERNPKDLSVEDVIETITTYLSSDKLDEVSDLIKKAKKLVKSKSKKDKKEMLSQINATIEARKQLVS